MSKTRTEMEESDSRDEMLQEAVADRVCLCTIYDVRCTIWGIPALARECGGAGAVAELWSGVRAWLERGGGGGAWRRLCTIYDVRCTIWGVPALAREFGWRNSYSEGDVG